MRPREERRPTVAELAQQKHVLQKINGWKVYHLTAQMEDLAELEKQVFTKNSLNIWIEMTDSLSNLRAKFRADFSPGIRDIHKQRLQILSLRVHTGYF